MRDEKRIDVFCEELKTIWKRNPDLRFCQLIINAFPSISTMYYTEDNEVLNKLRYLYED